MTIDSFSFQESSTCASRKRNSHGRKGVLLCCFTSLGLLGVTVIGCAADTGDELTTTTQPLSSDTGHGSASTSDPLTSDTEVSSMSAGQANAAQQRNISSTMRISGTDFKSFGVGGLRQSGKGSITVTGILGTVTQVLLIWHGPSSTRGNTDAIAFNGRRVVGYEIGVSGSNNWPPYTDSRSYWANVTGLFYGNGAYPLARFGDHASTINGASLLVFYENDDPADDRDVFFVLGNDSSCASLFDDIGFTATLNNVYLVDGGDAKLELHVADGQPYPDHQILFNGTQLLAAGNSFGGTTVPAATTPSTAKNLWDIRSFNVSSRLSAGTNTVVISTGALPSGPSFDCLSFVAATVDVPSRCPWGGVYVSDPSGQDRCRYTYGDFGRRQAARYAMTWAKSACPLFCSFQFANYVTGTEQCADGTDCANFVSQALFFGGMPMTTGSSCNFDTYDSICVRAASWAGAWRLNSAGLPHYYAEWIPGTYDTYKIVLGTQTTPPSVPDNVPAGWELANSNTLAATLQPGVGEDIGTASQLLNVLGITRGDIMYTYTYYDSISTDEHVLLVVGWGPQVSTWPELAEVDLSQLAPHRMPHSKPPRIVPYVIDHGPQQIYALSSVVGEHKATIAGAKPYYMTRTPVDDNDDTWFLSYNRRHFIKIPVSFEIPFGEVIKPAGTGPLHGRMKSTCPVP